EDDRLTADGVDPRFLIPAKFLDEIAGDLWGRRARLWRRPFAVPFAGSDDAFRALCELTRRYDERGDSRIVPRLFLDGKPRGFDLGVHAVRPGDGDLAGYFRRLRDGVRGTEVGLVIDNAQALDEQLWFRSVELLRGLYRRLGMPGGGA